MIVQELDFPTAIGILYATRQWEAAEALIKWQLQQLNK